MKNLLIALIVAAGGLQAQSTLDTIFASRARASFASLRELLAIPNDAHHADDIERNVAWCEAAFGERGFETRRLTTPEAPLLLAEYPVDGAEKTVLVYLQVDGQPVYPEAWYQDDPYQATLKEAAPDGGWVARDWEDLYTHELDPEWRIFARSTADSKGAVMMFLTAMDLMRDREERPDFNVKVIMDFEEEIGSPNLPEAVEEYREALAADMLVIFDGPRHLSNQPTLVFGARGISEITLKVFGPIYPQHSGHYGNWAPNPAERLAALISGMKDEAGRVTLPGFYDGIELDEETRRVMAAVPDDTRRINYRLGIAEATAVGEDYQSSLQYPSLNVRGISSGWVGDEARTIVPATAVAELDIRLVLESDPDRLIGLVRQYIEDRGYYLTDGAPTERERLQHPRICQFNASTSYLAFRTDFNSEIGRWLDRALTKAFGRPPIKQRTSGGSIPISPFVNTLGIPAVTCPTVNRDNNQHSPNENIRLGNYVDGIRTMYAVLGEGL